mmetsp:Transcript_16748/g.20131  ORF Transcript_16748/g.20131 Transcript_16748/m.20131 type:complete len:117 (-) Transcript_16748:31-381(-)|eukprot:CAMPEP_0197843342 /NCGR_PEP_ID=MMETSP1438-20131217/200_1 /TAXON_ID=1461541 /ORGANISM="Pterosperma sp., Strain CCMP1384" /LENGTH=116 /DNA_ID=CAMNT_0043453425 /DNA_START=655 /DNA_END=1005 /DNA_ORIENTATION=-
MCSKSPSDSSKSSGSTTTPGTHGVDHNLSDLPAGNVIMLDILDGNNGRLIITDIVIQKCTNNSNSGSKHRTKTRKRIDSLSVNATDHVSAPSWDAIDGSDGPSTASMNSRMVRTVL